MSLDTIANSIRFSAEYCRKTSATSFEFVFHGGEPLLAPTRIEQFVTLARSTFHSVCSVTFAVQTNGTLLDHELCQLLRRLDVRVGISLDGPRRYHDLARVDHHGAGSYDVALCGWTNAQAANLAPGLLLVANPGIPPADLVEWFVSLNPRVVDILLSDTAHDMERAANRGPIGQATYGSWLSDVFDEWERHPKATFRVKLFDSIVGALLGQSTSYEGLGGNESATVIVDTDGTVEPSDVLKICQIACGDKSFSVRNDTLEDVIKDDVIVSYKNASNLLAESCRLCNVREICRGGTLTHRYKAATGFDNPSAYCEDLLYLIRSIGSWLNQQISRT